jgi:hypothetical protein
VSWGESASDFEPGDGLRDIYVHGVTAEEWDTAYRFLTARYPHVFRRNGVQEDSPDDVHGILGGTHEASMLLALDVQGLQVNCHFFTAEEIELDLDPAEVVDASSFQAVTALLTELGRLLGKRVILTHENTPEALVLEYLPSDDQVRYRPPRFEGPEG